MNFEEIFEYVKTHKNELSTDELDSLAFLCSAISQDRHMVEAPCGISHDDLYACYDTSCPFIEVDTGNVPDCVFYENTMKELDLI